MVAQFRSQTISGTFCIPPHPHNSARWDMSRHKGDAEQDEGVHRKKRAKSNAGAGLSLQVRCPDEAVTCRACCPQQALLRRHMHEHVWCCHLCVQHQSFTLTVLSREGRLAALLSPWGVYSYRPRAPKTQGCLCFFRRSPSS